MAASSGSPTRVTFHGRIPLEDVPAAVAAADLGIAPTRLDDFTATSLSTKVFEYAALRQAGRRVAPAARRADIRPGHRPDLSVRGRRRDGGRDRQDRRRRARPARPGRAHSRSRREAGLGRGGRPLCCHRRSPGSAPSARRESEDRRTWGRESMSPSHRERRQGADDDGELATPAVPPAPEPPEPGSPAPGLVPTKGDPGRPTAKRIANLEARSHDLEAELERRGDLLREAVATTKVQTRELRQVRRELDALRRRRSVRLAVAVADRVRPVAVRIRAARHVCGRGPGRPP